MKNNGNGQLFTRDHVIIALIAILLAIVVYLIIEIISCKGELKKCQSRCDSNCLTRLDNCNTNLDDYKSRYKEEKNTLEDRNDDFLDAARMDKSLLNQCQYSYNSVWWMAMLSWAIIMILLALMCCYTCQSFLRDIRYRYYGTQILTIPNSNNYPLSLQQ